MDFPWYLLIPLGAAAVYAVASLCFKQAYAGGAQTTTALYALNFACVVVFAPLFFAVREWPVAGELWKPAVTAGLVYAGTWTTFAAIRAGDVSLVTPLMGTKVVLTAVLATVLAGTRLPAGLWGAAGLTTAGILVLGWRDLRRGQGKVGAILWCLTSALIFAGCDVSIGHWAADYGRDAFLATVFTLVGVVSVLMAWREGAKLWRMPGVAGRWLGLGTALMTGQTFSMAWSIARFHDPTGINVMYGTRGLWSIVLVWYVGKRWFGNAERVESASRMGLRLAGSVLILLAVGVALLARR